VCVYVMDLLYFIEKQGSFFSKKRVLIEI